MFYARTRLRVNAKAAVVLTVLILVALPYAMRAFANSPSAQTSLKGLSGALQSPVSVAGFFDFNLNNHDSESALALFAEGATVSDISNIACLPGPPPFCPYYSAYTTQTQIRGWLEQLVRINVQLKEVGTFQVTGNNVSWVVEVSVDEYRRLGVAPLAANANAIVENGKISSLTIAVTTDSIGRLAAARTSSRASPYAIMAGGVAFGTILLGLVLPAAAVYYISRVKRLFATVPGLAKPWTLLGAGVGLLFLSVLLLALRDIEGISGSAIDSVFDAVLVVCCLTVMSAMVLMKRVMAGEPNE